ncbi:hypothetical protein LCGC14_2338740 [marine sediment metagenome]|uniref:Uncharacterized protein n=1 Tax=marine sediment metagenome TaxID=412755 RepID=A0A0F9CCI7_9ZZZZ
MAEVKISGMTPGTTLKLIEAVDDSDSTKSLTKAVIKSIFSDVLIYDSGASQAGNVYSSAADLLTALGASSGGVTVVQRTSFTLPAGSHDLSKAIFWIGETVTPWLAPDGSTFASGPLPKMIQVNIELESLAAGDNGKYTSPSGVPIIWEIGLGSTIKSTGDTAAIKVPAGSILIVFATERAEINEGAVPLIESTGGTAVIWVFNGAKVEQNTLKSTSGTFIFEYSGDSAGFVSFTQSGSITFGQRGGNLGGVRSFYKTNIVLQPGNGGGVIPVVSNDEVNSGRKLVIQGYSYFNSGVAWTLTSGNDTLTFRNTGGGQYFDLTMLSTVLSIPSRLENDFNDLDNTEPDVFLAGRGGTPGEGLELYLDGLWSGGGNVTMSIWGMVI